MNEPIVRVRVYRAATTSREYDAITVYVGGLAFTADVVSDRQIRQAKRLAESHEATWQVSPELQSRVDAALQEESKC